MAITTSAPGAAALSAGFLAAFAQTVGIEGGFTADRQDKGNWTGGKVGVGELRGTKYGISAASYPTVDIRNLSLDAARAIYLRDFWTPIGGDALPLPLAFLAFDAAANNGAGTAGRWVQQAAGVAADGKVGPVTLRAIAAAAAGPAGLTALCIEFQARRINAMAVLPTWKRYGLGWARRLCTTLSNTPKPP